MHTKMLDYRSISKDGRSHADEDWCIGDKSELIYSLPVQEVTRHKIVSTTSLCFSSALENEGLDSFMSPHSCFLTTQISSDLELEAGPVIDIDSGIFELEL